MNSLSPDTSLRRQHSFFSLHLASAIAIYLAVQLYSGLSHANEFSLFRTPENLRDSEETDRIWPRLLAGQLSTDGSAAIMQVSGGQFAQGIYWTPDDGATVVPAPEGFNVATFADISADGSTVIGSARVSFSTEDRAQTRAFVWSPTSGFELIPPPLGGEYSTTNDISADGNSAIVFTRKEADDGSTREYWLWNRQAGYLQTLDHGLRNPRGFVGDEGSALYYSEGVAGVDEPFSLTWGDNEFRPVGSGQFGSGAVSRFIPGRAGNAKCPSGLSSTPSLWDMTSSVPLHLDVLESIGPTQRCCQRYDYGR